MSHIDLNVSDLAASCCFYRVLLGHLGFDERQLDEAGRSRWSLTYADNAMFEIEVRSSRQPSPRRGHERHGPGLDHLALHAETRDDIDELATKFLGAGFVVDDEPREYDYSPGYYAMALDDPDGVRVEVVHDPTRDTVPVSVEISYLVMRNRPVLDRSMDRLTLGMSPTPEPELNRFFYEAVGRPWIWHSRLYWSNDEWMARLIRPGLETWVASENGVPVGYFELLHERGKASVEIESFGLRPSFVGRGLGTELLQHCLEMAWRDDQTTCVTLSTCSLDHPRALPNYLAAGFDIERSEQIIDHIPRHLTTEIEATSIVAVNN